MHQSIAVLTDSELFLYLFANIVKSELVKYLDIVLVNKMLLRPRNCLL